MKDFGFVKTAAVCPRVTVGAADKNVDNMLPLIKGAASSGAQIIALPELCITGYTCSDLFSQDRLIESAETALGRLILECADIGALVIVGLPVRVRGRLFNCAAAFQNGRLVGVVPKSYLPNYNEFYEKRHFVSGLDTPCDTVTLCGQEVPFGNMLFCADNGAAVYACIDIKKLEALRRNSEFYDNAARYADRDIRRVDITLPELKESDIDRTFDAHPFVPSDEKVRRARCAEIFNIQAAGLAKRIEHIGLKKAVIGISGGLDSALALLVADKAFDLLALPKENIICITMPGFGTTKRTKSSAVTLTECIGAQLRDIDIVPACTQHMRDIGHDMSILDVTYENVQARERTQILMDTANKEGALLVGTGDLSELALGWCTYNADHMSMYGVNCSVPKTLVRYLVDFVADERGGKLGEVLREILATPVSPELLPPDKNGKIAQKTEDTLGPYEVHDFFLYHFQRFGASPDKLMFMACRAFDGVYSREQIEKWLRLFMKRFFSQQFKRSCIPDGPKVGSVSLSPRGDWRMPSDADASAWLDL